MALILGSAGIGGALLGGAAHPPVTAREVLPPVENPEMPIRAGSMLPESGLLAPNIKSMTLGTSRTRATAVAECRKTTTTKPWLARVSCTGSWEILWKSGPTPPPPWSCTTIGKDPEATGAFSTAQSGELRL